MKTTYEDLTKFRLRDLVWSAFYAVFLSAVAGSIGAKLGYDKGVEMGGSEIRSASVIIYEKDSLSKQKIAEILPAGFNENIRFHDDLYKIIMHQDNFEFSTKGITIFISKDINEEQKKGLESYIGGNNLK